MSSRRQARAPRRAAVQNRRGAEPACFKARCVQVWRAPEYADYPTASLAAWRSAQARFTVARRWWLIQQGAGERSAADRSFGVSRLARVPDDQVHQLRAEAEDLVQRARRTRKDDL